MPSPALPFKFQFMAKERALGLFAQKGSAQQDSLVLQDERIPYQALQSAVSRDDLLILGLSPSAQLSDKLRKNLVGNQFLVLKTSGAKPIQIKRPINLYLSATQAEAHRQSLARAGRENQYQTVNCPHCGSTVDLSERDATAYLYCQYCDSIFRRNSEMVSDGDSYGICDECHLFGRLQGRTLFYFYFLVVVYGYSVRRRFVCDTCAIRLAKRALLINLIFLLGVPSAIYLWVKAASGHAPDWGELTKANDLARQGKYAQADEIYQRLLSHYPDHPGLLFNQGFGHLQGKDMLGAQNFLGRSLRACNTYLPAEQLLHALGQPRSV